MNSESKDVPAHAEITSCAVSDDVNYKKFILQDKGITRFDKFLSQFLTEYFAESEIKPNQCLFTMFTFPGEDYREPMVKVIYTKSNSVDILKIR